MPSHASSVTLSNQSSSKKLAASTEDRLTAIERMLACQQVTLERLLSASEPRLSPALTPKEVHKPTPDLTPGEIYEQARAKAEFSNQHRWNAAYIQGLIRIDGEPSKSITRDPPCYSCANTNNLAVCVSLAENDPYCGFVLYEQEVCCGWCEDKKIQGEEDQLPEVNCRRASSSLDGSEDQNTKQKQGNSNHIDRQEQEKLSARKSPFFISGEGLDREVITNDIPLYLGSDALVHPGVKEVCVLRCKSKEHY
jgi:hypothetical protein